MNCACAGKGLDVTLCDFHVRVFAGKNNRLMLAANALFKKISVSAQASGYQEELNALADSLTENGVGLQDTAGPQYAKKAHFLLRRVYDLLLGEPKGVVDKKALDAWRKQRASMLEELRKVFKPST